MNPRTYNLFFLEGMSSSMRIIKGVVNEEVVNKFKEVSGKIVTIHNYDENFTATNVYEQLECCIDDCCIYLGESKKETYDYSILIHKIADIVIEEESVLIKFLNGNNLLIVIE